MSRDLGKEGLIDLTVTANADSGEDPARRTNLLGLPMCGVSTAYVRQCVHSLPGFYLGCLQ